MQVIARAVIKAAVSESLPGTDATVEARIGTAVASMFPVQSWTLSVDLVAVPV